jgi:hypothetical protein
VGPSSESEYGGGTELVVPEPGVPSVEEEGGRRRRVTLT